MHINNKYICPFCHVFIIFFQLCPQKRLESNGILVAISKTTSHILDSMYHLPI